MNTLDNIREVAPTSAVDRGEPVRLVAADAGAAARDAGTAYASGVGSLPDASA
ncbi:MAG: hypothetical protein ACP59X_20840 [Solidesulfovibrio sp. DCME]|uniref:hypothetical protein n=1 Tax=Solidesulfovibrio sp. DCME TaxID=3447380 RepID=UPI003D0D0158